MKWKNQYSKQDLRAAISYLDIDEEAKVEFIGYKMVNPKGLHFHKQKWTDITPEREGWGKNLSEEDLEAQYYAKYERNLWFDYFHKEINPAISIDDSVGDGMGRLLFAHALGEEARVAFFKRKTSAVFKQKVTSQFVVVADLNVRVLLPEHFGKRVRVYRNLHNGLWSIMDQRTKLVIAHSAAVVVENAKFVVSEAGRQRVLKTKQKVVHAFVDGILREDQPILGEPLTYNPYKFDCFYNPQTLREAKMAHTVRLAQKVSAAGVQYGRELHEADVA